MRTIAKASSAGSNQRQAKGLGRAFRGVFACALALLAFSGIGVSSAMAAPIPGDPCPNGDIRQAQGVAHLPDCMALEQVSPQFKDNQPARVRFADPFFGSPQFGGISPTGDRVRFISTGALGGTTGNLEAFGDWYVASRDAGSGQWTTSHANPPIGMTKGWVEVPYPYAFNADLSHWFHIASTPEQFEAGLGQAFRGGIGGESTPFSSLLTPLSGTPGGINNNVQPESGGSSADSSHLYFRMRDESKSITYLPGDPTPAGSGSTASTYIASLNADGDPSLELLTRDGNGKVWGANCGAQLGGGHLGDSVRNRGAISTDGSRTYFSTRPSQPASGSCNSANALRILKRVETAEGPWISQLISPECNRVANLPSVPACGTVGPSGTPVPDSDEIYEGASIEGSKVYFTTGRQLTNSDVNGIEAFGFSGCVDLFEGFGLGGCDLYLFDSAKPVGQRLTQVTAGSSGLSTPQVVTLSGDGSHAYFTSTEVLTSDPGPGITGTAQPGQTNLYVYDAEANELAFIARTNPGSAYPAPVLGDDPTEIGVGGDGHLLVFSSTVALTSDDLDGSKSDVFRYDADAGTLIRVSKAAPGGTDNGPAGVFVAPTLGKATDTNAPDYVVRGRWVSEDGETISFKTQEALLPADVNGVLDSYVSRNGQLFLLPGTADPGGNLVDDALVSADGNLVAFQSFEHLLPRDRDTAVDVYALRVAGGFPEPPVVEDCQPDSNGGCQGPAGGPIGGAGGASASLVGPGNLASSVRANRCARPARRAKRLSNRAKRLRRAARSSKAPAVKRKRMRGARRSANRARRLSRNAKRCRRANRRAAR